MPQLCAEGALNFLYFVVAVSLHGVAGIAEGLEVARIVTPAFLAGNDVIDLKSFDFG